MTASQPCNSATPLVDKATPTYSYTEHSDVEDAKGVCHQGSMQGGGSTLINLLKCVGPGLMLGLANSNAGDLLAAAQSGAKYKFLYLPWIVLLAVPLYIGTELVTRISVANGAPLLKLIYESFGFWVTLAIVVVLGVSCMGGLVMQFCTFVAVGGTWGVPGIPICLVLTALLVTIVLTDNVQRTEKVGIVLGLFELSFVVSAVLAKPDADDMLHSTNVFGDTLQANHSTITGALIGAVLMPWMFFYQASAVNRNQVSEEGLDEARLDIGLGTVASQLTMGSILVTFAIAMQHTSANLDTVQFPEIPGFLDAVLPHATFMFSMGMTGAAFVASLAIALTISWAVEEIFAMHPEYSKDPARQQFAAKVAFTAAVLVACMFSLAGLQAIWMIIFCDIVNSLTVLPIILVILYLSHAKLQPSHCLVGVRKVLTFLVMLFMGLCGLYSASCFLLKTFTSTTDEDAVQGDTEYTIESAMASSWRYSTASSNSVKIVDPIIYFLLALVMVIVQFKLAGNLTPQQLVAHVDEDLDNRK